MKNKLFKYILYILGSFLFICAIIIIAFLIRQHDVYDLVPDDTLAVISIHDPVHVWSEFEKSTLWQYFQDTKIASHIYPVFSEIHKTLGSELNQKFLQLLFKKQVAIIVSPFDNELHYAFLADMGMKSNLMQFANIFKETFIKDIHSIELRCMEFTDYHIDIVRLIEEKEEIVFTFVHNILIVSDDPGLIKKLIMTCSDESKSLKHNSAFEKVKDVITHDNRIKLFINTKRLFPAIREAFQTPLNPIVEELTKLSEFIGIGISWQDDGLLMQGYSAFDTQYDSSNVNLILSQQSHRSKIYKIVPHNVTSNVTITFKEFNDLRQFTLNRLENDREIWKLYNESKKELEGDLGVNFEDDLFSWIGNELGVFSLPKQFEGQKDKNIFWLASKDKKLTIESLERIKNAISKRNPIVFKDRIYKGFAIGYIDLPLYLKIILNPVFKRMTKPYWVLIDHYLFFSDNMENLETIISAYITENNIINNEDYQELSAKVPEVSNISVYLRIEPTLNTLRSTLKRSAVRSLNNMEQYLEKFDFAGMNVNNHKYGFKSLLFLKLKHQSLSHNILRWKIGTTAKILASPIAANLDGIRGNEIIFGNESGKMYAVTSEGRSLPGWPRYFEDSIVHTPVVTDIDNDGKPEIIVDVGSRLFVMDTKGNNFSKNWPKQFNAPILNRPAVGYLDDDNNLGIILTVNNQVFVLNRGADTLPGWPQETKSPIRSLPVIADLNDSKSHEIIVATMNGDLYIWNSNGQLLENWPQSTNSVITATPIIKDMNGDNHPEIITASWNGDINIMDIDGRHLEGSPFHVTGIISATPLIMDLDADGTHEIIVTTENQYVYILNDKGEMVNGWPQRLRDKIKTSPCVIDINRDGEFEIFVASEDGNVYGWDLSGRLLPGWPVRGSTKPIIDDFNRDGVFDMAIGSWDKQFYFYSLNVRE